jgi:hypothetical protein
VHCGCVARVASRALGDRLRTELLPRERLHVGLPCCVIE